MYIPNAGELVIFIAAFVGACIGFLWYNAYPAEVFMGDTGSLALGGIIAALAIIVRKELLIPVMCGIFLIENLSVVMQVSYFKYTKKKFGEGRRVFLMSPLHHHYQKLGMHESKIVSRFWISWNSAGHFNSCYLEDSLIMKTIGEIISGCSCCGHQREFAK
jgi:phospho-N-acetylmuramoyl-pentapeptide-transferase